METSARLQKETLFQRIIPDDFRPVVEWRGGRLNNDPKLALGMMDKSYGRAFGWGDVPRSRTDPFPSAKTLVHILHRGVLSLMIYE